MILDLIDDESANYVPLTTNAPGNYFIVLGHPKRTAKGNGTSEWTSYKFNVKSENMATAFACAFNACFALCARTFC